jgi:hypothetical protein
MGPEGASHLSLSWASPIQSLSRHPTSSTSILILPSHLRLVLPSGLFPSGGFVHHTTLMFLKALCLVTPESRSHNQQFPVPAVFTHYTLSVRTFTQHCAVHCCHVVSTNTAVADGWFCAHTVNSDMTVWQRAALDRSVTHGNTTDGTDEM